MQVTRFLVIKFVDTHGNPGTESQKGTSSFLLWKSSHIYNSRIFLIAMAIYRTNPIVFTDIKYHVRYDIPVVRCQ